MGVYKVEKVFSDGDFQKAFRSLTPNEQQDCIATGTLIDTIAKTMIQPYSEWLDAHQVPYHFRFEPVHGDADLAVRCFFHIDDRDSALLFKLLVDDLA